jgi:HK97 family phage prohead protease
VKETRLCEVRAAEPAGDSGLTLTGVPIVYDTPTVIDSPAGRYTEIIRRGALDSADLTDARLLYNHDLTKVPLARTPKTMTLERGPAGLNMAAVLPDTEEARSVYTAVKRGDLSGMSFAFKIPQGGDRWNRETRTREILKIEKVYEISIVPFPAYPETSVEARSVVQEITNGIKADALIKCNQILFHGFVKKG